MASELIRTNILHLHMTAPSSYRPYPSRFCAASRLFLLLALLFSSVPFLRAGSTPNEDPAVTAAPTASAAPANDHESTKPAPLEKLSAMDLEALEFGDEGFDWRHDWWKYLIMVFASLLALFLFLLLARMLFSLVLSLACLLISLLGSLILSPLFTSRLDQYISTPLFGVVTTRHLALGLSFVLCYMVTSLIMRLAYHPKPGGKK